MIHFDSFTPVAGDCTQAFYVSGFESTNSYDFVGEVLNECPHDWGYFSIHFPDNKFVSRIHPLELEYSNQCTKDDIPLFWKNLQIDKVISSGGYSRMDYVIYVL